MGNRRLDEISDLVRGVSFPSSAKKFESGKGLIPCLRTANVQDTLTYEDLWYIPESNIRNENQKLRNGDIVLSSANSQELVGKSAIFKQKNGIEFTFGAFLTVIRPKPETDPRYLAYILRSPDILRQFRGDSSATTNISNLSNSKLAPIGIPCPDLNAQKKIANRIDLLFSEIDSGTKELENVKQNLELYRQSVLNAAIQGKHFPQDLKDEPASALLEKIKKEKEQLISEKKIKREKPFSPVSKEELPFELPEGWEWTCLSNVCESITDGDHQAPPKSNTGIPFIVISDMNKGIINLDTDRKVPKEYYNDLSYVRKPKAGDILFSVTGSYGIPEMVRTNDKFCFQRHIAILRPTKFVLGEYIYLFLKSKFCFNQATSCATGTAQMTVPLSGLRKILIPVPPKNAQVNIVDNVKLVLEAVNVQSNAIEKSILDSALLKQSILKKAFDGELI